MDKNQAKAYDSANHYGDILGSEGLWTNVLALNMKCNIGEYRSYHLKEGKGYMIVQNQVEHMKSIDSTLALMTEGYRFISKRMKKYHTDIFVTRLLGKKTICLTGEEAARLIYNPDLFQRNKAVPPRVQKTLFGEQAIQTMDGEQHLHRKQLFLSLLTPAEEEKLAKLLTKNWEDQISSWEKSDSVVLYDEANEVLCRTACTWAGIPLEEVEVKERAADFAAMVDSFGGIGPRYQKGKAARKRTEKWLTSIIHEVRCGSIDAQDKTALYAMSNYIDLSGSRISDAMAAIELINIVRPIVAISTYITFAALALYKHPKWRDRLLTKNVINMGMFLQEVRRFYPFAPLLGAIVKENFTWKQIHFKKGRVVLLDMYGTNHDHRIWKKPNRFWPENFAEWNGSLFGFVPQGGGNPTSGHRCPGEGVTMGLMKVSIDFLLHKIEYEVPEQDLRVNLVRMPTLPQSGFQMSRIRRKPEEESY